MENLIEAIRRREARIVVIGLGYVGLPVAHLIDLGWVEVK